MAVTFTDQDIRDNVWDEISHDIRIDASNMNLRVVDGIVYLEGTVPTYSEKMATGQDARRIKGVVDVVNDLVVSPSRPWTDSEISETIRRNVDLDVRVPEPSKIRVAVTNGVVTLSGVVSTYAQKTAAADDAWAAPGVVDVINESDVVPQRRRSDADIQADVRNALDHDPDINAARIRVSVVDGVVYLLGSVPTFYQIDEASDDAWGVPGVVNVVNELAASP